jgi:hypothetical protein
MQILHALVHETCCNLAITAECSVWMIPYIANHYPWFERQVQPKEKVLACVICSPKGLQNVKTDNTSYAASDQACRTKLAKAGCLPALLRETRRNLAIVTESAPLMGNAAGSAAIAEALNQPGPEGVEQLLGVLERLAADDAASAHALAAPQVPHLDRPYQHCQHVFFW